jgi:hypothetical protein
MVTQFYSLELEMLEQKGLQEWVMSVKMDLYEMVEQVMGIKVELDLLMVVSIQLMELPSLKQ